MLSGGVPVVGSLLVLVVSVGFMLCGWFLLLLVLLCSFLVFRGGVSRVVLFLF